MCSHFVLISFCIWLFNSTKVNGQCIQEFAPTTQEAVSGFFGVYVQIGEFAAPVILLGMLLLLPSLMSRKVFDLKDKLESHFTDKEAHKGES